MQYNRIRHKAVEDNTRQDNTIRCQTRHGDAIKQKTGTTIEYTLRKYRTRQDNSIQDKTRHQGNAVQYKTT